MSGPAVSGPAVSDSAVSDSAVGAALADGVVATGSADSTTALRGRVVRGGGDRLSVRFDGRCAVVGAGLLVAIVVVAAVTMTTGEYSLSVREVFDSLTGHGTAGTDFVVTTLRLPRLLTGLLVGAALGVSGAIFQSLTANPLGSPDVIGFTAGSATGAVVVILVLHGTAYETSLGAIVGGVATAVAIYVLSFRHGVAGPRLILIGIGVGAMLTSVNSYLIVRATLADAVTAQTWLLGSLNRRSWEQVRPLGLAVAVLLPVGLYYGRRLPYLAMGADTAKALGVPVERSRLALLGVGAALAACATAAAGPVGFVALSAPPLARHLTRSAEPALLPTALLGALLVATSDLVAQRAFAPSQLPVGVATNAVGGLYLAWFLARNRRRL